MVRIDMSGLGSLLQRGALAVLLALSATVALADNWDVDGRLNGKPDRQTGEPSESVDISGIACAQPQGFPRTCLVIDDDSQAAQVVTLTDGRIKAGAMVKLIDNSFDDGRPVWLDGEGVAFADNYFYVMGSHGGPRRMDDPARVAAIVKGTSQIVRLRYDAATGAIVKDAVSDAFDKLIRADAALMRARETPLEQGGLTIEGIAVLNGRLYAGFRGPLIERDGKRDRALIMSVALDHIFGNAPADVQKSEIRLGEGRGVRDLVAYDNSILILAGPMNSDNGTYSIYRWSGRADDDAKRLDDLPDYFSDKNANKPDRAQWKPEALLPLDRDGKGLRVLLLLDGGKNGKPRTRRIDYP